MAGRKGKERSGVNLGSWKGLTSDWVMQAVTSQEAGVEGEGRRKRGAREPLMWGFLRIPTSFESLVCGRLCMYVYVSN